MNFVDYLLQEMREKGYDTQQPQSSFQYLGYKNGLIATILTIVWVIGLMIIVFIEALILGLIGFDKVPNIVFLIVIIPYYLLTKKITHSKGFCSAFKKYKEIRMYMEGGMVVFNEIAKNKIRKIDLDNFKQILFKAYKNKSETNLILNIYPKQGSKKSFVFGKQIDERMFYTLLLIIVYFKNRPDIAESLYTEFQQKRGYIHQDDIF